MIRFLPILLICSCFNSTSKPTSPINKAIEYAKTGDVDNLLNLVDNNKSLFETVVEEEVSIDAWNYKDPTSGNNFLHFFALGKSDNVSMLKMLLAKGTSSTLENGDEDPQTPESLLIDSPESERFYKGVVKDYQGDNIHAEMQDINTNIIINTALTDIDDAKKGVIDSFVKPQFFTPTDQIDNIIALILYLKRLGTNDTSYNNVIDKFENSNTLDLSATSRIPDGDTNELRGASLMHFAAYYGRSEAVKLLSWAGVSVNIVTNNENETDKNGIKTPLEFAIQKNNIETVQVLLELGANGDELVDKDHIIVGDIGYYPSRLTYLHAAILADDYNLARALILGGVDINAKDGDEGALHGNTPLHLARLRELNGNAVSASNIKNLLISRGANTTITNVAGKTYDELILDNATAYFTYEELIEEV